MKLFILIMTLLFIGMILTADEKTTNTKRHKIFVPISIGRVTTFAPI